MTGVSALVLRSGFVEPGMDGIACNQAQSRIVFDPSPEVDSLVEALVAMRDGVDPGELLTAERLLVELLRVNRAEGDIWRAVTGRADALACELHRLEVTGAAPCGLATRALANALRAPLGVLCAPIVDPIAAADAVRAVDRVTAVLPRERIVGGSLEHQLGGRRYRRLVELFDRRDAV